MNRTRSTAPASATGTGRPIVGRTWPGAAVIAWRRVTPIAWLRVTPIAWLRVEPIAWRRVPNIAWRRVTPIAWRLVVAIALLASLPLSPTLAAGLGDRVPVEDPALSPRARPVVAVPPAPAPSTGLIYGAVEWTVSSLAALPAATRQGLWEVAYIFGVNATPVQRPVAIPDPKGVLPAPAMPAAATPAVQVPDAPPLRAPRLPLVTDLAKTAVDGGEIEPGLLANFVYDRGDRRPDGSYFIPKTLQRLFHIRTMTAQAAEIPVIVRIAGRIVPDPHAHGTVQASLTGRIEPPETGLPVLGSTVARGDLLGWVHPSVGVVDRTQVRREVARLTTEIRLETESLEILKQFYLVPFRDGKVYQTEQKLAGLRRERDALLPLLQTREALVASSDGIVSVSNAIAGRIVQAGEVVFEIVDPKRLWIEAAAPDPTLAAQASAVAAASASTPEGTQLALHFVGSGLSLREQSTPILFRIDNPPEGLRIGRPVTVTIESQVRMRRGIPISRAAVTVGSDGVQSVWEQTAPEVFVPHPVRLQDVDGATVLIVDSIADGARLVVGGARLMAQLQ